jgi:hypothetical protein
MVMAEGVGYNVLIPKARPNIVSSWPFSGRRN